MCFHIGLFLLKPNTKFFPALTDPEFFKVLEEAKQPCRDIMVLSSLAHCGSPEKMCLRCLELEEVQSPQPVEKAGR